VRQELNSVLRTEHARRILCSVSHVIISYELIYRVLRRFLCKSAGSMSRCSRIDIKSLCIVQVTYCGSRNVLVLIYFQGWDSCSSLMLHPIPKDALQSVRSAGTLDRLYLTVVWTAASSGSETLFYGRPLWDPPIYSLNLKCPFDIRLFSRQLTCRNN
jgi:hypothetical protein